MSSLRVPHFLTTVRHYVMLEVDKTRAITPPPPEKTKQYIVLLACNHTKNLRYKNAKGSTRSISPDAKRSTGVIAPPPMQQEKHAGRDPPHAAGRSTRAVSPPHTTREPHSGGPHLVSSVVLGRTLAHARCFRPFPAIARRASALRRSARFGKARCTKRQAG